MNNNFIYIYTHSNIHPNVLTKKTSKPKPFYYLASTDILPVQKDAIEISLICTQHHSHVYLLWG